MVRKNRRTYSRNEQLQSQIKPQRCRTRVRARLSRHSELRNWNVSRLKPLPLRGSNERIFFLNCMRELKETTLDVLTLVFHPVHYDSELGVSIEQHQGFLRHPNKAAQALQREFRRHDDGISMTSSKQKETTKVGISAPDELARENMICRTRKHDLQERMECRKNLHKMLLGVPRP